METLALIELLDRDGQVRHCVRVTQWPVRIGRAIDCDVVLDDPHVAAHHASLVWGDDGVHVVPTPSVNGVSFGRSRIAAGSAPALMPGTPLTVGATTLRVRVAGESLAPEQPLAAQVAQGRRAMWLIGLAIVALLWSGFEQWLGAAPGSSGTEMTGVFLAVPVALGIWCGLWAMGSKLFQRQFAFWPHLEVALFWPLVAVVIDAAASQMAFALSMPLLAKMGRIAAIAALSMLLWRHLAIVLPQRRREFALVIAAVIAVGGGLNIADRVRHQQPLIGSLYLGTISLPQVRVARPVSADVFVQSAQPLEKALSHWVKSGADDADTPESDEDQ
jgi:pSer/pThr/pTyr-binding forkhead associated (FHA) protein